MLKRCSKCGLEKDISDFYRRSASKDGYQFLCKLCMLNLHGAYQQTPKGKIRHACIVAKYQQTPKGKTAQAQATKKYNQTKNGKIVKARAAKKYFQTPNGKIAMKRVMHRRHDCAKNTEATLTSAQWGIIIRLQGNRCNICKQKFTKRRPSTIDHIIPLSKGGHLTFENVQALCGSCNSRKNAKLDLGVIQTWSHRQ